MVIERGRSAGEGKKRPGFDRVRKMIRKGHASGLVVWKIDRCSRSVRDFADILSELRKHDADFVSVTEPSFDTSSAMGRAMLQITMVFAELERERTRERVKAWADHRARKGLAPQGKALFGYRYDEDMNYIPDEDTAPVVKEAVRVYLETGSIGAANGVFVKAGDLKRGLTGTRTLLKSPTLAGYRVADGVYVAGDWPPIISLEDHEAVLSIHASTSRGRGRPRRSPWLLTGIAICAKSGHIMGAGNRTPRPGLLPNYKCHHQALAPHERPLCGMSIPIAMLEPYVEASVLLRITPEMWTSMRARQNAVSRPVVTDAVALDRELSQLAEDWGKGLLTRTEFYAAKTAMLNRIEEVNAASFDEDDDGAELPDIADLHKSWPTMSVEHKRLVISAVIDHVKVKPGRRGPRGNKRLMETRHGPRRHPLATARGLIQGPVAGGPQRLHRRPRRRGGGAERNRQARRPQPESGLRSPVHSIGRPISWTDP